MTCTMVPCAPGEQPTWVLPAPGRGGQMETWAGWQDCVGCLDPCDWLVDATGNIFDKRSDPQNPTFTGRNVAEFLGDATEIVQQMLAERGYDYGVCRYLYRPPCRCGCPSTCSCGVYIDWIDLSDQGNVIDILDLRIGGVTLPEFDGATGHRNWELVNCRYLVRRDPQASCTTGPGGVCGCGEQARHMWPNDQRIDLDWTEPCTWGIEYRAGTPVPADVRRAVQCVACTLAKECLGLPCNSLPTGAESVSQFGVNISIAQLQKSLDGNTDTYGCAAVRRMLSTRPKMLPVGWIDPLAPCDELPGQFLYDTRRV